MKILSYDNTAEYLPEGSRSASSGTEVLDQKAGISTRIHGGLVVTVTGGDKALLIRDMMLQSMNSRLL